VIVALSDGSTLIGESTLVNGNVHGDEDLTVLGRLEGTLTLTKALVVEPSGTVKAEVQVRSAVVSGAVFGNVTASESVEVTRGGRVLGDISAPRVVIADGASFKGRITGDVEIGEAAEPAERALPRAASRPALRARAEKDGAAEAPAADRAAVAAAGVKPPAPPVPVSMGAVKRKVIVRRK
jgi:cytoskeletal protein CcmA (bactofilin family)